MKQLNLLDNVLDDNDIILYCLARRVGDNNMVAYLYRIDHDKSLWEWTYDPEDAQVFYTAEAASETKRNGIDKYRKGLKVDVIEVTIGNHNQITYRTLLERD